MLDHFFAVTKTSIYEIVAKGTENGGRPSVQKIAVEGASDIMLGQELECGGMVAIGKYVITYIPEGGGITSFERRAEYVNTRYWLGNTSPVIGYFLTIEKARECFACKDRVPADLRWKVNSLEVLNLITNNHPVFYILQDENLRLF